MIFSTLFNKIFYQPLFNALVLLYEFVPGGDFGIAVVLLTLLIRILLYPFSLKAIESQRALAKLEPKLREIRKKFKDDKEKVAREMLELYQKEKINPFSGFFLILLQLPILFALYKVFTSCVSVKDFGQLYSFVPNPGEIKTNFLMIDLAKPDFLLSALAGVLQFFQAKKQTKIENIKKTGAGDFSHFSKILQKQMLYFFPITLFFVFLKIPSAIALYSIVSTIFSMLSTSYIQKRGN